MMTMTDDYATLIARSNVDLDILDDIYLDPDWDEEYDDPEFLAVNVGEYYE